MAKLISLTHLSNNSHIIPLKTSKPKDQIQTNSLNGIQGELSLSQGETELLFYLPALQ